MKLEEVLPALRVGKKIGLVAKYSSRMPCEGFGDLERYTKEMLACDLWEVVKEPVTFEMALAHMRAGGFARQLSWTHADKIGIRHPSGRNEFYFQYGGSTALSLQSIEATDWVLS